MGRKKPKPIKLPVDRTRYTTLSGVRRQFTDPATGETAYSASALKMAVARRHKLILDEFERLVREDGLGQDPWERLPMEGPVDYQRFLLYLKLGPDHPALGPNGEPRMSHAPRSIERVAFHVQIDRRDIQRLARKFHWELRGDCWQRKVDQESFVGMERDRRQSVARQQRLGARLQNLALRGADLLAADPDRLASMSPTEIVKLADTGVRVERASHTSPLDRSPSDNTVRIVWEGPAPDWMKPDGQPPATIDRQLQHSNSSGGQHGEGELSEGQDAGGGRDA